MYKTADEMGINGQRCGGFGLKTFNKRGAYANVFAKWPVILEDVKELGSNGQGAIHHLGSQVSNWTRIRCFRMLVCDFKASR